MPIYKNILSNAKSLWRRTERNVQGLLKGMGFNQAAHDRFFQNMELDRGISEVLHDSANARLAENAAQPISETMNVIGRQSGSRVPSPKITRGSIGDSISSYAQTHGDAFTTVSINPAVEEVAETVSSSGGEEIRAFSRQAGKPRKGWNKLRESATSGQAESYAQKEAFDSLSLDNRLPANVSSMSDVRPDVSLQMEALRPSNVGQAPTLVTGGSLTAASMYPNVGSTSFIPGGAINAETIASSRMQSEIIDSAMQEAPLTGIGRYTSSNVPARINDIPIPVESAPRADMVLQGIKEREKEKILTPGGSQRIISPERVPTDKSLVIPSGEKGLVVTQNADQAARAAEAERVAEAANGKNLPSTILAANQKKTVADQKPPVKDGTPWANGIKVALGTAVTGAALCAALSASRGQQNNAQLYGQQPLY